MTDSVNCRAFFEPVTFDIKEYQAARRRLGAGLGAAAFFFFAFATVVFVAFVAAFALEEGATSDAAIAAFTTGGASSSALEPDAGP
jgi:hypothetical protein